MSTSATPTPSSANDDPFASLLTLESQFHSEGYALGYADGSKAGRIEGRVFGLEKGFEKFAEMGLLGGQAAVWEARLPSSATPAAEAGVKGQAEVGQGGGLNVKALSGSERLAKHVRRLRELTDPANVPMENSEEAVQSFDESLKDAKAKTTLISKIVGETGDDARAGATGDFASSGVRGGVRVKRDEVRGKGGEMEDFVGMRGVASK